MGPIVKGQVVQETSVSIYQFKLRNIPEERISQLQGGRSLKP